MSIDPAPGPPRVAWRLRVAPHVGGSTAGGVPTLSRHTGIPQNRTNMSNQRARTGPPFRRPRALTQRGITGLETAIILIAFVVVASVFAFTILSAGVFSSERSKETIHAGLEEAQTTSAPRGSVIGIRGDVDGEDALVTLTFTVAVTGEAPTIDLTPPHTFDDTGTDPDPSGLAARSNISYVDGRQYILEMPWTVEFLGNDNGDFVLDRGENADITVWLHELDTGTGVYSLGAPGGNYLEERLGVNRTFTLTFSPPQGSTFTLGRTTPPALHAVVNLK